jgi:dihydrofolate reductase
MFAGDDSRDAWILWPTKKVGEHSLVPTCSHHPIAQLNHSSRSMNSASPQTSIALVLAMADNGVIGAQGGIPWRIPEDMRYFKGLTLGKPCIMGRKTWESLPKKPLPGRTNIVVTRDRSFSADGAVVAHSFEEALSLAKKESLSEIMIIGGAEIYAAALPLADTVYLTEVHRAFEGDTMLRGFARDRWEEIAREEHATPDGLAYSFVTLRRK